MRLIPASHSRLRGAMRVHRSI